MKFSYKLLLTVVTVSLFAITVLKFELFAQQNSARGATLVVIPNANTSTAATLTFLGPLANAQRTYQWLIHESELTNLVGKQLTSLTYRIPPNATEPWPASDVTFTNYDIYLSESVAPADRSLTFALNVVGTQTQVRSGQLMIPANSFPSGGNPNNFGMEIEFNTPWLYAGGHLLVELRHTGFTGTSRSNEAISASGGPPYGTLVSACWTGNYTGTSGSQGNFAVLRLTGEDAGGNANSGNNGQVGDNLYYFANSLATSAPSFPDYNWRDTTGSTNLVLNGVATATINNGNLDDGRFDVIGQLPGTNAIRFFGVNYTDFYIGTNGFVAFYPLTNASSTWNIPASGLPNATVTNAYFAFWKDLNYGDVDVPVNRLSYKITSTEVIITFDRAPNFNTGTDANDYVSFQIIMEHAPAPATNTRMFTMFNFDQTGSSFITKYNDNTLAAHIIGLQNANAADKILSYRFRNAGGVIDPAGPIFGSNLAVAYGADQNALPVDLLSFTANVDGNNVTLNWTTAWEENNMKFDIQRRVAESDAQWVTIGSVLGKGTYYGETNYSYYDNNLTTGKYEYRLIQIDFDGNSTADFNLNQVVEVGVPTRFDLAQNYPNPFNPTTKINFQIPVEGLVKLSVFDMSGREVATLVNESLTPGYYTYDFNATNLSSGAYFYRLITNNSVITKKMMLVK